MDSITIASIVFSVAIVVFLVVSVIPILRKKKKGTTATSTELDPSTKQLKLQAYERLILLADRMALPNLIPRLSQPGFTAQQMQVLLIENIKQEFEYNITQQMYVSPEAWSAIKNLKEQNISIVSQIANLLPETATGFDLNRVLAEFLLNDKKGTLHEIVSEILSYEAKELM
ncbi:MAG: hypothetical protein MUE72_12495 [Chitinophagaceae bacterium]|nr:hypothetical protein [Chitinophagaceae bacterium]